MSRDDKKSKMAKMARKISCSTVCILAFSAVALATMPSGRHPIIAFFEAIKQCCMEDQTNTMVQTANLTCLASIVMSSMRHGLIASKKASYDGMSSS